MEVSKKCIGKLFLLPKSEWTTVRWKGIEHSTISPGFLGTDQYTHLFQFLLTGVVEDDSFSGHGNTIALNEDPMTLPASVEGPTQNAFNTYYGVDPLAGSMITGIFLIGIGVGSLFSGPFSETFGRNAVYFSALLLAMLFIMAKALAPNYGAAIAFRFICALFAATPMTVAGGTVGDVWQPQQIPFGLPFATFCAYSGPILGPVIGAYTPEIGCAWADWISMIVMGVTIIFVLLA